MILVTVGMQLPFDRLIHTMDEWARRNSRHDVFAQIGRKGLRPSHIEWAEVITPELFRQRANEASMIVAHAGMGSIITALELGKPILVMPRRSYLKEQRNDHQVDTARQFLAQGRINVAFDEDELVACLDKLHEPQRCFPEKISVVASPELINALRIFIHSGTVFPTSKDSSGASVSKPQIALARTSTAHETAIHQ